MNRFIIALVWLGFSMIAGAQQVRSWQNAPVIGYAYPAGGCRQSEVEIAVGGVALAGVKAVVFSGTGLSATVLKHYKPLNNMVENKIRELLKAERDKGDKVRKMLRDEELVKEFAGREGISADDIEMFIEMAAQRRDPKRQLNAQLAERVVLRVKIAPDAQVGRHDLRLLSTNGLSNPVSFVVGTLPEITEVEPNDVVAPTTAPVKFPVVINGRILPGDVDGFAFDARKGMHLTVAVAARELTPYLADAVPGWFQAVAVIEDHDGREIASGGGFSFRPDPLTCVVIPADGRYVLKIRDSICRGREDFVYRVSIGELPCLTKQFPLGGRVGTKASVEVSGWNLPVAQSVVDVGDVPGARLQSARPPILSFVKFDAGCFPESNESDADDGFPRTINGIISKPGEHDVHRVRLKSGTQVVAEVRARRLGSPLDSMLHVVGPDHKEVAANDDHDDPSEGLLTHHADSFVSFTAAADGIYQFDVHDTQGGGGKGYVYRLSVGPPQPGFDMRIVPSSLNGRAGSMVPVTARVLRRDGFAGEITVSLKDAPKGFELLGGKVPEGKDSVQMILKFPNESTTSVVPLHIEARAKINDRDVVEVVEPAEDRMQAFFYRHLVPVDDLLAWVGERPKAVKAAPVSVAAVMDGLRPACTAGVTIPVGGTATLKLQGLQRAAPGKKLVFALNAPPPGISLTSRQVDQFTEFTFAADAALVKPGNLGNLIVNVLAEMPPRQENPKAKAKVVSIKIGALPPIGCRIAAAPTAR